MASYRRAVTVSSMLLFRLLNLAPQEFDVDALVVLGNRSQFSMETSVFKDAKRQHVGRRADPNGPGVDWITKDLEKTSKALRGSTRDADPVVSDGFLRVVKVSQPSGY